MLYTESYVLKPPPQKPTRERDQHRVLRRNSTRVIWSSEIEMFKTFSYGIQITTVVRHTHTSTKFITFGTFCYSGLI